VVCGGSVPERRPGARHRSSARAAHPRRFPSRAGAAPGSPRIPTGRALAGRSRARGTGADADRRCAGAGPAAHPAAAPTGKPAGPTRPHDPVPHLPHPDGPASSPLGRSSPQGSPTGTRTCAWCRIGRARTVSFRRSSPPRSPFRCVREHAVARSAGTALGSRSRWRPSTACRPRRGAGGTRDVRGRWSALSTSFARALAQRAGRARGGKDEGPGEPPTVAGGPKRGGRGTGRARRTGGAITLWPRRIGTVPVAGRAPGGSTGRVAHGSVRVGAMRARERAPGADRGSVGPAPSERWL
jgi:hypothetical protein